MEKKIVQPMASRAFINEGDDIILSINAEAKARIKQGEDIINASIGTLFDEDGHFSSIPIINQALQANLDVDGRSYPTVGGGPKFEQGILDWLLYGESEAIRKEFKTRVVATTGGTGAVTLALRNYTELHQTVLIPSQDGQI
jgi:aspartate/tyrosine/aromatic aminotransferase